MINQIISEIVMSSYVFDILHSSHQLRKSNSSAHTALSHGLVKNAFELAVLLIMHNHVVQDDTTKHHICDALQVPLPAGILHDFKSHLKNPESPLNVLSQGRLEFGEVLLLLSLRRVNGLDETAPLRINTICQQVVSVVCMTIYLELHSRGVTFKEVGDEGGTV
jgi:hypothetical protein